MSWLCVRQCHESTDVPFLQYHSLRQLTRGCNGRWRLSCREKVLSPVISCEERTRSGYLTRVAVGQGVGVADAEYMRTLQPVMWW